MEFQVTDRKAMVICEFIVVGGKAGYCVLECLLDGSELTL